MYYLGVFIASSESTSSLPIELVQNTVTQTMNKTIDPYITSRRMFRAYSASQLLNSMTMSTYLLLYKWLIIQTED